MDQLVIIGDSWSCGEWIHYNSNSIKLNHPGMTEYLPYKTLNLSKAGASNWQTLYSLFNFLNQRQDTGREYAFVLVKSDPTRNKLAEKFNVDIDKSIQEADSLEQLYTSLAEIFYIKISELSKQFDVPVYIVGGLSDVDKSIFSMYNNVENIICDSWMKLLYEDHNLSVVPLQFRSNLFSRAKKLGRLDLCDQIIETNDATFSEFTEILSLDTFGPSLGDFHPSRLGHEILAEKITNFIEKKTNA